MVLEWAGQTFTLTGPSTVAFEPMVLEWAGQPIAIAGPRTIPFVPMVLEWQGGTFTGGQPTLINTRDRRASVVAFKSPISPLFPTPDGSLASLADRLFLAFEYTGLGVEAGAGGSPGNPGGTDWFVTEIGRWVRGLTTQFDGHPILARWKAEAEAAASAGAPYPWFTSELQRRFLDYFISVQ